MHIAQTRTLSECLSRANAHILHYDTMQHDPGPVLRAAGEQKK